MGWLVNTLCFQIAVKSIPKGMIRDETSIAQWYIGVYITHLGDEEYQRVLYHIFNDLKLVLETKSLGSADGSNLRNLKSTDLETTSFGNIWQPFFVVLIINILSFHAGYISLGLMVQVHWGGVWREIFLKANISVGSQLVSKKFLAPFQLAILHGWSHHYRVVAWRGGISHSIVDFLGLSDILGLTARCTWI